MGSARRTEDELITVVENNEGIGGMGGGNEDDTHLGVVCRLCIDSW